MTDIAVVDLLAILDDMEVRIADFFARFPELLVLEDSTDIGIAEELIAIGPDVWRE